MNLLLWTDDPNQESLLPLYERLAAMGFDGLELPIFSGEPEAYSVLGRRLADLGLACTAVAVCNGEDDPISPNAATRNAARESLHHAIDCAEAAGAELLGGPLFAAIGRFSGKGPTQAEWDRSQEVLGNAADHAEHAGLQLAFEFLNRFEIYLLNTAEDTTRYVQELGRANVGVHYDTFHAHIEEKDPGDAIRKTGTALRHVHIAENDRGTPGTGQVRWDDSFDALAAISYDGWLTIEAFGSALPSLAAATKIWRRTFDDEESLARDGLAFMKDAWGRRKGRGSE
ncbi:MAG: sugar phosphate isomerase/epimerase [Deltaproteobacteria bacterium]|nr:sugar phosphate isomerase/epimerase [Deltaproteobacteria bacterium]MBW2395658.1 sugar phosphate isomerase/epimerase [Deltaproteobacteria bacterium]